MNERDEDVIWDRACSPGSERLHLPGDRALADMILVHGLIMNGGVHHAIKALTKEEMSAGIAGYSYFGLTPIAVFLASVRDDPLKTSWTEINDYEVNRRYYELVPDDEVLIGAFDTMFCERPDDFQRVNV